MTTDPNLGRVLANQYGIDALLGHGGMGSVYRGRQLSIQRPVAIKLIAGAIASNEECIKRFRREAEAMAMLHHPNTVRLFDFGVEQSELFMVMELLEGEDLSEHLTRRGALPLQEALGILREVLQALSEAHARGIVHRDLKPANVFMTKVHGGQVFAKVMDFGIAGIEADSKTKLTLAGAVLGTPTYMSPEQAQGNSVDARSDLYSLGVMLFEMVTGSVPFAADSIVSLLLAQVSKPPPRLAEVRPDLARILKLQTLLDSLLAKAPDQRPRDAAEALIRVEELLRDLASGAAITELGPMPHAMGRAECAPAPGHRAADPRATAEAPTALAASKPAVQAASSFPDTFSALLRRQRDKGPLAPIVAGLLLVGSLFALVALWPDASHVSEARTALAAHVERKEPTEPTARKEPTARPEAGRRTGGSEPRPSDTREHDAVDPPAATSAQRRTQAPSVVEASERPSVDSADGAAAARPFPKLRNTLDKIFGTTEGGYGPSRSDRRQALLARGPAHNNVASAKRAYRAGTLSEADYEDTIWVLKTRRARRIEAEKQNVRAGAISKEEYKRRVDRIDQEYKGS